MDKVQRPASKPLNGIRFNPAIGVANYFAFRFNGYLVVHQDNQFATLFFIFNNQWITFRNSDLFTIVKRNFHRKTLSI
ncbi:hypothetical protein CE143_18015 [Photorhabdus luminescens]|nr:hypothetical protein CE143_18015 [Photorhabdus luminescens]